MLHLSNPAGFRSDDVLQYTSKAEREEFSGRKHDVVIYILFRDLLDVLDRLDMDDYPWSPRQIYLLNAVGQLLENYSLFYLPEKFNVLGFGPQSLQDGDLVSPLKLDGGLSEGDSDLVEGRISAMRDAVVLRMSDSNDLGRKTISPEARALGPCFCLFSLRAVYGSFPFTID
jgi:hypothetical protein